MSKVNQKQAIMREKIVSFFGFILKSKQYHDVPYKVIVSDRCEALFESVADSQFGMLSNSLMTRNGLLLRTEELAEYFRKNKKFPKILLINDIDYYGRGINAIISEILERLYIHLDVADGISEKGDIRNALLKSLYTELLLSKKQLELMCPELQSRYNKYGRLISIKSKRDFCDWIQAINFYSKESFVPREVSAISVQLSRGDAECVRNALHQNGYERRDVGDSCVWAKTLYGDKASRAVVSFQMLSHGDSTKIIPHFFCGNMEHKDFAQVLKALDAILNLRLRGQVLSKSNFSYHAIGAVSFMMLNHLLLINLLSLSGVEYGVCLFDEKKMIRFLGGDKQAEEFLYEFIRVSANADESQIRKIFNLIVRVSKGFSLGRTYDAVSMEHVKSLLEYHIYNKAVGVERVAFFLLNGGVTRQISQAGRKSMTIPYYCSQIERLFSSNEMKISLNILLSVMLCFINEGYCTTDVREVADGEYICQCMGVEDFALSIYPQKFEKYLPLLFEMERYCLWGWEDMSWKLEKLCKKCLEKEYLWKELWYFVRSVHISGGGGSLEDWMDLPQNDDPFVQKYRRWKHLS